MACPARRQRLLRVQAVLLVGMLTAVVAAAPAATATTGPAGLRAAAANPPVPELTVSTVVDGLSNPWDVTFTPDGTMLFDQLRGGLGAVLPTGEVRYLDADFADNFTGNESGVMGLVVDPGFANNRTLYICQTLRGPDPAQPGVGSATSVVRWRVAADYGSAVRDGTVVSGIRPANTEGRHVGCRLRFDDAGLLYVSTGDGNSPTGPEDITSPLGKVLRVTTAGDPAPENPFAADENDWAKRVFTFGHRNPQGLAWRATTGRMWSVEQGPNRDDEINLLAAGADYGWNPVGPGGAYQDNGTPMTREGATPAAWSSGSPTIATSGGTFLAGTGWGAWEGALAVATLKGVSLRMFSVAETSQVARTAAGDPATTVAEPGPEVTLTGGDDGAVVTSAGATATATADPIGTAFSGTFGRLRTAQLGPDGDLFVTTSNGNGQDKILRIRPVWPCDGPADDPVPSGVAATRLDSTTVVSVRGNDDAVWYRTAQSGWVSVGGVTRNGPATASWDGRRIDLFAVGTDGGLYHRVGWPDGPWWPWESLGGVLTSAPAAVAPSPGRLDIYGRGADRALWRISWTGSRWTSWESVGGQLASAPGAAAGDNGRTVVGVRGLNGQEYRVRPAGGFDSVGTPICSAPAYANGGGAGPVVAYRLGSQDISLSGRSIGGVLTSSPAVTADAGSGRLDVFARGNDNGLWTYSTAGAGWTSWGGSLR